MPGLYSVMDAIDRELMKAMNAGMDPSSRAIFKSLYDSWTAHGRWDKSWVYQTRAPKKTGT